VRRHRSKPDPFRLRLRQPFARAIIKLGLRGGSRGRPFPAAILAPATCRRACSRRLSAGRVSLLRQADAKCPERVMSTNGRACAARQLHTQLRNVPVDESHRGLVPIGDIGAAQRKCGRDSIRVQRFERRPCLAALSISCDSVIPHQKPLIMFAKTSGSDLLFGNLTLFRKINGGPGCPNPPSSILSLRKLTLMRAQRISQGHICRRRHVGRPEHIRCSRIRNQR
jgi:hypothetical protein